MTQPMDTPDEDRPSNMLEQFAELPEVLEMIAGLPIAIQSQQFEKSYETFSERLARYQEQPHLLDPHLDRLLSNLLVYIRDAATPAPLYHAAFKYMYQVSKVRTFKVLVKCMPHEIADLDFVLGHLERQIRDDAEHWETRYILLMWMSILVMNPFQMSRLDAFAAADAKGDELTKAERIFRVCQATSNSNDTCSSVAAYLVSKHLIRVDIKDEYLPRFFDWIIEANPHDSSQLKTGQLAAIAAVLKHGKREDLLVHTDRLMRWVVGCNYKELSDYLKSKLFIKIVQRLGLVMLKPRLAQWRYQRGQRSLTKNLAESGSEVADMGAVVVPDDESDEDIQVPDAIEDVIEELLQSLRSPSSAIRWSAAKGIGRVTNRLPKAMGDEVVGSVIEILHPLEPHEAWHGACLAVAELSKRGLLLPYRLEAMVPNLQKALIYDEMKGYMSVGQHIRDAACYVAWAFARAYEPSVLLPFVDRIAAGLLVTTVFDREINCRRAASAAFQESVGRLGNFKHGIDILTAADFYTVGVRSNAYLVISDFVAQYVEYRQPLIDHLVEHKISHWDTAIRELTAKTMFRLTIRDPTYMSTVVLPTLFEKTNSIDVNLRHGAVLCIGEIVRSLKELQDIGGGSVVYLTPQLICTVNELLLKFLKRDQFRGLSGDIMKMCCCDFIRNCSQAELPTNKDCIESWQTIIDGCITKKSAPLREAAIAALAAMAHTYYSTRSVDQNNELVLGYLAHCDDSMEQNIRMGYVSAVGGLPTFMLAPCFTEVMRQLIKLSLKSNADQATCTWAESRRDAVKAIGKVVERFGFEDAGCLAALDNVFACLLKAQLEYTVDDRGDIGAWVREAAMNVLCNLCVTCPSDLLQPDTVSAVMVGFAQQAVEIIDRTRGLAANLFWKLVYMEPRIPHIPRHDVLLDIFPADTADVLWIYADHTFPMFCSMLALPEYSPRIILGISASMGKLSESLVKHSSTALFTFLRVHPEHVARICEEIISVFAGHLHNDPISHPFLNFLDVLLASGTISSILLNDENHFADELFRLVKLETKGQKKLYKLVSSINVFCHLIQVPRLCTKVLATLAVYLGLMHVHVRKSTATKLYEAIVIHGDTTSIPEENVDDILEILSETDWGMPLADVRPIRNNLCTLMGIKAPVSLAAPTAN